MANASCSASGLRSGVLGVVVAVGIIGFTTIPVKAQNFLPVPSAAKESLPARADLFDAGTPLARSWTSFVEAQNAEDSNLALRQIAVVEPLVQARFGRVSEQMAMILGHKSVTLMRLGQVIEAETAAQEALATSRALSGPTSEQALSAANTLAAVYLVDRGDGSGQRRIYATEAVRLLEGALAEAGNDETPNATLRALQNSLAVSYFILERPVDAVTLYKALLETLVASRPPNDPEIISVAINLAHAHSSASQKALVDAERLTAQIEALPLPVDPVLLVRRDALDEAALSGDVEADRVLASLIEATPAGPETTTLQYANLLSARARLGMDPDQRVAALRGAVARYHQAGCRDPETRRQQWIAAGGRGYPWTTADPECAGDLRLASTLSGYRGLAFAEKVSSPPRTFAALRHLANASDVVVGATRLTYAQNREARLAFNRYRHVHREFVDTAWAAVSP